MFAIIGENFPAFHLLPRRIRAVVSLVANIIDEMNVVPNLELEKGWRFIDVGAHVGAYSALARRLVGRNGIVVAVEPDPDNFRELLVNMRLVGRNGIPVRAAICNRNGSRLFYRYYAGSLGSLLPGNSPKAPIIVNCLTLDRLYEILKKRRLIDRVDAVKVDVEGAEEEVLRGAPHVLEMSRFILVEVHDSNKLKPLAAILARSGFQVRAIGSHRHILGIKHKLAN